MKPFLLLQHRYLDEASDNEFEAVLQYSKLEPGELVRVRIEQQSISYINPLDFSGIITGGGPANVSDEEEDKSAIQLRFEDEMNTLYYKIFEYDIPYLGMCYGMGSVTRYLGGEVSKYRFSEPVGKVQIHLEQPVTDPILKDVPSSFSAFVGHKESCQKLPDGATLLASSSTCPVQMIRCKQHIYATQFHPELDVPGIILRIRAYKNHGYFDPEEAESLIDSIRNDVIQYPQKILENFVSLFRRS
ncbi:MAG: glutamine amidotransferase [Balneola sp.]